MPVDPVYETLHPFHQWAQIAAVCALLLALASCAVLTFSRRFSRRWWLGLGILGLCLLVVAFGERSRSASVDLRPVVVGCLAPPGISGCDIWLSFVTDAQRRVATLGALTLVCTVFGLIVASIALIRMRNANVVGPHLSPAVIGLLIGIFTAGFGVMLTADSIAQWLETTKFNPGDGLGLLPQLYAMFGTGVGVVAMVIGLLAVIACTPPRHERTAPAVSVSLE